MPRRTIVLVDDDRHLLDLLQEYLESLGFFVFTGSDGRSAVALAKARRADLVVLDVDMPFMNGLEALAALRKDPQTNGIPVIMLTGVMSERVYPVISSTPKVSHVKKPVSLEDLGSLVNHYLPTANAE